LGCYYLTEDRPSPKPAGRVFADANEARLAYDQGVVDVHTRITVRVPDQQIHDAPPPAPTVAPRRGRIETTVGRLIFNELLPDHLRYRNYAMTKECLKQLIAETLSSKSSLGGVLPENVHPGLGTASLLIQERLIRSIT